MFAVCDRSLTLGEMSHDSGGEYFSFLIADVLQRRRQSALGALQCYRSALNLFRNPRLFLQRRDRKR